MTHTATYDYNRYRPSIWRVRCTCGWWHIGTRDECETRFTGHDLGPEWIAEEPAEPHWKRRLNEIKGGRDAT